MIHYWIFQALPEDFDIQARLHRDQPKITNWQVNQHPRDVKEGDRAFLWACKGRQPYAALCGFVEVLCDPIPMAELSFETRFYPAGSRLSQAELPRVLCRILATAWITKDAMVQSQPALAALPNLRQPQGTDYPLTDDNQVKLLKQLMGVW
jgi:hypothetical protein